ncbi:MULTISPECIES: hypothetical protein [unclassified Rhizobium]|uniref:hypothetical protein n=1 Tax=unclassified Rhizobium TaxID=2613769 RepID=UPI001ADAEBB1|nr:MULTISPECIES: hypothetical protein [unclassified Rhizobium]MBO9122208.1 hypothetical protein [Rhizobium sp. 16-488-2b]MBO9172722.1 hypothetical protein [Rhizobium sp. 16-488-2a]
MINVTSSSDNGRGSTLRVDLTGVLACLLMAVIVACAIIGYGTRHRIDDVAQPVGPKATQQQAVDGDVANGG